MTHVDVVLQRTDVQIPQGTTFPIFSGFLSPEDILRIAKVPNFEGWEYDDLQTPAVILSQGDSHQQLAANLLVNPTEDWQRPLSGKRKVKISEIYSDAGTKRLMANPVLLGEDRVATAGQTANIGNHQATGGIDQYSIRFTANPDQPLLILDGQHRIYGLAHNAATRGNKIPIVVLLESADYTKEFLAQIFTEVTTGAQKLSPIHEHWMKYTFSMDPFDVANYRRAMEVVISLCNTVQIDGTDNEFYNQVKFNPTHRADVGPWNVTLNCIEWTQFIVQYYENCPLPSNQKMDRDDLTKVIVRFIRAAVEKDQHQGGVADDSKLFGTVKNPHSIIRDALIKQLFKYCAANSNTAMIKSKQDWINDVLDPGNFSNSDWRLSWVTSGTLSSIWAKPSKKCANQFFGNMFSNQIANNAAISSKIKSHSQVVTIIGNRTTNGGKMSGAQGTKGSQTVGHGANVSINLNSANWPDINNGTINREWIRVAIESDTCGSSLREVRWSTAHSHGNSKISGGKQSGPIDLRGKTSPIMIVAETVGYSKDSMNTMTITVDF